MSWRREIPICTGTTTPNMIRGRRSSEEQRPRRTTSPRRPPTFLKSASTWALLTSLSRISDWPPPCSGRAICKMQSSDGRRDVTSKSTSLVTRTTLSISSRKSTGRSCQNGTAPTSLSRELLQNTVSETTTRLVMPSRVTHSPEMPSLRKDFSFWQALPGRAARRRHGRRSSKPMRSPAQMRAAFCCSCFARRTSRRLTSS
mmetsp:Transcript_4926/g.14831  ORF Transcript_4926/g.14831 Transcript_4926/m.14831 type:complete len:201 (+) Transcript_4926:232-834(+)